MERLGTSMMCTVQYHFARVLLPPGAAQIAELQRKAEFLPRAFISNDASTLLLFYRHLLLFIRD